ncbi:MAG: pyruvate kinase [Thermosphaera sp.]
MGDLKGPSDFAVKCSRFAVDMYFSYLAVSYVRSAGDLELIRDTVRTFGGNLVLISKIDCVSLWEFEGMIALSDAVLVAWVYLGLHFGLGEVPIIQKEVVEKAQQVRKLMEFTVDQPVPAGSDVPGVYTLVEALVNALVLTNETAVERSPLGCVEWLRIIIDVMERSVEHSKIFQLRSKLLDDSLRRSKLRPPLSS